MTQITVLQAPEDIDKKIERLIVKKGIKSLNAIWKNIRFDKSVDLIGDYPLMNYLLISIKYKYPKFQITKEALSSMIRTSKFYMDEGKKFYIPKEWLEFINAEKPALNLKTHQASHFVKKDDISGLVEKDTPLNSNY